MRKKRLPLFRQAIHRMRTSTLLTDRLGCNHVCRRQRRELLPYSSGRHPESRFNSFDAERSLLLQELEYLPSR